MVRTYLHNDKNAETLRRSRSEVVFPHACRRFSLSRWAQGRYRRASSYCRQMSSLLLYWDQASCC